MQPLWKIVWRYFKKLKIVLNLIQSYDHTDPANPLVCINLEKARNLILKDTCTPKFIAALFTTAKSWKQLKGLTTDKWIKKMWKIYIYMQPHGLWLARLLCPWDFPGKNADVGCHSLFQRIFPIQGSNPHLQH